MKFVFNWIKPFWVIVGVLVMNHNTYASMAVTDDTELNVINNVTLQGSYRELSTVNEEEALAYSAKYEGYYTLSPPQREWSSWDVLLRPWIVSNSSNELSDPFGAGGAQFEGEYFELREFYYRKNILFGFPAAELTVGRQQYTGDYGIWWDDSFESVQFEWDATTKGGFLAVGQLYHSYSYNFNGTTNDLSPSELDIAYVIGEYWFQPYSDVRAGLRLFAQNDFSVPNDKSDDSDFTGGKLGLFISGRGQGHQLDLIDYYVDLSVTKGKHQNINSNGILNGEVDSQGWAILADVGYELGDRTRQQRISVRGGMTDSPDNQFSGNYVAPIQSDRKTNDGTYSTGISGTFLKNRFTNVAFFGASYRTDVSERSQVEFMVFDIRQRNADVPLSATIGDDYSDGPGSHIGNTFEVFFFNKMFPSAVKGHLLDIEYLVSAGYFRGGDAIADTINDYKLSVGINFKY